MTLYARTQYGSAKGQAKGAKFTYGFVNDEVWRKAFQMETDCQKAENVEDTSIHPLTVVQLSGKSTLCF